MVGSYWEEHHLIISEDRKGHDRKYSHYHITKLQNHLMTFKEQQYMNNLDKQYKNF